MAEKNSFDNPPESFNLNSFPDLILLEIFKNIEFEDLCKCSRVCRRWYELTQEKVLRKRIVVERYLKPVQVKKLVKQHFHRELEEFQFLNNDTRLCVVKKKTFLRLHDKCPQLKKLALTCCSLKYVSLEDMPESLQFLGLRRSELNPYAFFKCHPEQYVPNLTCLDLGGVVTFITSENLHILNCINSLRCLYLEHCFRINDGGIESMVDLISHLEVLDVEGTDISNEGAQIIIEHGVMLKKLYIGFTRIDDFVFEGIYMDKFLRLTHLCVRFTNICLDTIKKLRKYKGIKVEYTRDSDRRIIGSDKSILAVRFRECNHYLFHSCSL